MLENQGCQALWKYGYLVDFGDNSIDIKLEVLQSLSFIPGSRVFFLRYSNFGFNYNMLRDLSIATLLETMRSTFELCTAFLSSTVAQHSRAPNSEEDNNMLPEPSPAPSRRSDKTDDECHEAHDPEAGHPSAGKFAHLKHVVNGK